MSSNETIPPNLITALVGAFVFFVWLREKTIELYKAKKRKEWIQQCKQRKRPIKKIDWMVEGLQVEGNLSSAYADILGLNRDKNITIEKIKNAANYRLLVLKDEDNEEKFIKEIIIAARDCLCDRVDYLTSYN